MEKQYNVAFLGVKPATEGAIDYEEQVANIGIRIYNSLTPDKIIDIVQNTHRGILDDKVLGLSADKHCYHMFGGRTVLLDRAITRKNVEQVMKNVDVLIIAGNTEYVFANYFLGLLAGMRLSKDFIVVFRMPFDKDDKPFMPVDVSTWMTSMGLNLTNNDTRKKNIQSSKQEIYVIGMSEYGGMSPDEGISLLQSRLSVGMVDKVLGPVKETGSAGKSLMDWGRHWISKLIHSN